ncbi:MAG TPA: hypothetical protein VGF28_09180 [Thermoanaerobaculia bacterium]|jgi:hypothetical protein
MSFTPSERPDRAVSAAGAETGAAGAETTPETPTLTHYQQVSDRVVAMLDEAIAMIPQFQIKHPTTAKFVNGHLNIPVPFMEKAVAGVANSPSLQAVSKLDVMAARNTLQLNEAFRHVVDKLFNLAKNLKYTLDTGVAILGADSLQVYSVAKALGRDPAGADMLQFAADLKRELNRPGPKKAAKAPLAPSTGTTPALVPESEKRRKKGREEEVQAVAATPQ